MKCMILGFVLLLSMLTGYSQILKKVANAAKNKVEQKSVQKTEETVEKVMDTKLTKKTEDPTADQKTESSESPKASSEASFASYSKFDFVPGEKVIAFEDFSADLVGDFPSKWNTNATGEIVTVEGFPGKWLKLDATGVYMPEFINELPENFTIEFDLICNPEFRYESSPLYFATALLTKPSEYTVWMQGSGGRKGFNVALLPQNPSGKNGRVNYEYHNESGDNSGERETNRFFAPKKNKVRISLWRQKQRIRVYLDDDKVVDVPKALNTGNYNAIVFALNTSKTKPDQYLISNIRLAVGAPDTRNKLLTEGKFVTNGILFDVNSDRILPASYPVLKEIASVLKSEETLKVKITGHTDSDGDATANKTLSERRAASVKKALETEFGIASERLQTSGSGEAEPVGDNKTSAGKAQNRRVEFAKL